jgi:O-antigen ligase
MRDSGGFRATPPSIVPEEEQMGESGRSGDVTSSSPWAAGVVAILFMLFVNQGVIYYVQRFSLGGEFLNPWPIFLATIAASGVALGSKMISVKFVRLSLASFAVCILFAATYVWSPSGEYGLNKAMLTLFVPALCILAGFVVARDGRLQLLLATSAVLAALTAIVAVMNEHDPSLFAKDERERDVIINYQNFAFVMALGSVWAIDRWARRLPTPDLVAVIGLFVFVYFILQSGGRLGLLLVFLTGMIFLWRGTRDRLLALILIGICVLVTGAVVLVLQVHAVEIANSPDAPATLKRMVYYAFLQPEGNTSAGTRDVFYRLAVEVFWRSPLLGVGWGGFPAAAGLTDVSGNYPHNLVLELLAETGVIGTLAFVIFVGFVLHGFIRDQGDMTDKNTVFALFLVGFATSMVGGDWPSQRLLFFSFGAMAGFSARYSGGASGWDVSGRLKLADYETEDPDFRGRTTA